jgi:hypothetical protein
LTVFDKIVKKENLFRRIMPPTKDAEAKSIGDLVEKYINENDVMIFSRSWCPYCKKVCTWFFIYLFIRRILFID